MFKQIILQLSVLVFLVACDKPKQPLIDKKPTAQTIIDKSMALIQSPGLLKVNSSDAVDKASVEWEVKKQEIDELTMKSQTSTVLSRTKRVSIDVNLYKEAGKETIFHIYAYDKNNNQDHVSLRVFNLGETSVFWFKTKGNPPVPVYVNMPNTVNKKTRVLMLHHGILRNAKGVLGHFSSSSLAQRYVLIAPMFSKKDWPDGHAYQQGNMFSKSDGAGSANHKDKWSLTIADAIGVYFLNALKLESQHYDAWGHSAGAQFLHRMLMFNKQAAIRYALVANPGWWTLPSLVEPYPYGLKHSALSYENKDILDWTNKKMVIFRGVEDTGTKYLRKTQKANEQGATRFARAKYMYDQGVIKNSRLKWQLIDVAGVGHSSSGMSKRAVEFLNNTSASN